MSTNHTEHYQLCLWEEDDPVQRTDFNEDNEKIETALKGLKTDKAEQTALSALAGQVTALEQGRLLYHYGEYVGTGEYGNLHPCRLEFPFKLLAIMIIDTTDWRYGGFFWLKGASSAAAYLDNVGNNMVLSWEERAVQWYHGYSYSTAAYQLNSNVRTYKYLALGVPD